MSARSMTRRFLVAGVSVATLSVLGLPTANAIPSDENETAQRIAEVAPGSQNLVKPQVEGSEGFVFGTEEAKAVGVHRKGENIEVSLQDTTGSDLPDISVSLPDEAQAENGKAARDGTLVYSDAADNATAAVQTLESGAVRIQTILNDAAAPTSFTYEFAEDLTLIEGDGGTIEILAPADAGINVSVGTIAAPWAVDANGSEIETSYEVKENVLVQHVTLDEATAFPVIADPTFGHSYGVPTVYLNRSETGSARNAGYAGWACGFFPVPYNLLCGGNIAIITKGAHDAYNAGKCVKILVGPGVLNAPAYSC